MHDQQNIKIRKHFISLNYLGNIFSIYKHATCNFQSWQQNISLFYFIYKLNGAGSDVFSATLLRKLLNLKYRMK